MRPRRRRSARRAHPARRRAALARGHRHPGRTRRRGGALRRRAQVAQGNESSGHRGERAGAHREGPRGRGQAGGARASITSRSPSCAGPRTSSSSARLVPALDQARGQDREGHRAPEPLRDPRRLGRDHGGPRRSGRRAAVRGSAADAEADHSRGQPARQAGDHRHADARVDGPRSAAHTGRGVGRRQRHSRWYRRRHALRRNGGGRVSARGGSRDGPDRPRDGAPAPRSRSASHRRRPRPAHGRRPGLPACTASRRRADPHRRRDRRGGLRRGRDARRPAHRLLHQQRVHGAEGCHLPPHGADLRLHAGAGDVPPALDGVGRDARC